MKKKIETGTIIRTAVLGIALLNQILTASGQSPLPFTQEETVQGISVIVTAGASLWAWWKNNSFTQKAIEADEKLYERKEEYL